MIKFNKKQKQIIIKSVGVLEDTYKDLQKQILVDKEYYSPKSFGGDYAEEELEVNTERLKLCKKIKNKLMKDFYSEYENGDYCIWATAST